jgi:hypothetical protein
VPEDWEAFRFFLKKKKKKEERKKERPPFSQKDHKRKRGGLHKGDLFCRSIQQFCFRKAEFAGRLWGWPVMTPAFARRFSQ